MKILADLQLDPSQYFTERTAKDLIVLHHTVGASACSTFDAWQSAPDHIATAFLVERDGAIHQTFPPEGWAYHVGVKGARSLDRRSIGIEIASEGPLLEKDGEYFAFGRYAPSTRYTGPVYRHPETWRGRQIFAAYSPQAIESVIQLVDNLLTLYSIPRQTPADHLSADAVAYREFRGVLGHHQLRPDKTDVHPGFPWQELIDRCRLDLFGPGFVAPMIHASAEQLALRHPE